MNSVFHKAKWVCIGKCMLLNLGRTRKVIPPPRYKGGGGGGLMEPSAWGFDILQYLEAILP